MKALVKFDKGLEGMELREVPDPVPQNDDIKVKVMAAGICGSDIHIAEDRIAIADSIVIGHEFVGIVDCIGPNVRNYQPGDWVTSLTTYRSCGKCDYCRHGKVMFCEERRGLGFQVNGAISEYVLISEENAMHVPNEIKDKISIAACEPFGCAVRATLERSGIKDGDVIVICGPGALGLGVVQAAKLFNTKVFVLGLESDKERLNLALKLGADEVFTDQEELRSKISKDYPCGPDLSFEITGTEVCINFLISLLKKGGTLVQMGLPGAYPRVNVKGIVDKEITVKSNFGCHPSTWNLVFDLLKEKKVTIDHYTNCQLPLSDWNKGFKIARENSALKVLLVPDELY